MREWLEQLELNIAISVPTLSPFSIEFDMMNRGSCFLLALAVGKRQANIIFIYAGLMQNYQ